MTANQARDFVARIETPGGRAIGSGFLIDDWHVLTCFHVVETAGRECDEVRVFFSGNAQYGATRAGGGPAHDLAIFKLHKEVQDITPVRFLSGMTSDYEQKLSAIPWVATGFALEDFQYRKEARIEGPRSYTVAGATLTHAQVTMGLPEGFSGGPVLVSSGNEWFCLGVSLRGGADRATSRVLLGDCVIGFLTEIQALGGLDRVPAAFALPQFFDRLTRKGVPPRVEHVTHEPVRGDVGKRAAVLLVVALIVLATLAGLWQAGFFRPQPNIQTQTPDGQKQKPAPSPVPSAPPPKTYLVSVALPLIVDTPIFRVDRKRVDPASYSGGIAGFRLAQGHHHIEVDYPDRSCSADLLVPEEQSVSPPCPLKPVR